MLTSYPSLDSAFSNPVVVCPSLSCSPLGDSHQHQQLFCFQLPADRGCSTCPKDWPRRPKDRPQPRKSSMEIAVEPEDDLKCLVDNDLKLRLSGYYYGNLSWVDASALLKQCAVGTFLVRDSEHCSYLYALSVQTKRGPTSCRIEYHSGRFRLDCSDELTDKMPRFDSVPDLVDHYVQLTRNLPKKSTRELSPVWLDMDEENTMDVPVQIYRPLYKQVRSLQHMCRVSLVKLQKQRQPFARTIDEYKILPTVLKDYLKEYPYSQ